MSSNLKHKVISGVLWQGAERIGNQGISFVISVILARLLAPEEFGVIAIIFVFINFCSVFVDSGFSIALIQKKELAPGDCSSVFYINIAVALVLYFLLFLCAPAIAEFYNNSGLVAYLRVLALLLVIRSFSLVQGALLAKNMLFHLNCRISWSALLISGTTGVVMAYNGFGIWALVAQQLVMGVVSGIFLWWFVKWRPQCFFDYRAIKAMFNFGGKMFVSSLLDSLYNNLYSIIIGKCFSLATLSYYNRGNSIPQMGMGIVNSTVGSVILPAFAGIQNDRERIRHLATKGIKCMMFLVVPILALLIVIAEPLVIIVLTDKWLPAVVFLQLSCLTFLFWPLHTLNLQIITACGRSDLFLLLEIIKKIQLALVVLVTYRYGVIAMVWGLIFLGPVCFVENAWFSRKMINYPFWKQFLDFLPILSVAAVGALCTSAVCCFISGNWLKLFVGCFMFSILYLSGTTVMKLIPDDMISILKSRTLAS